MQNTGCKTPHSTDFYLKCYSFYRDERSLRILQFCSTFFTQNTVFNIICYFDVILPPFQFSQITENITFFCANYSIEIYAKYNFSTNMFRKLQESILRKIQLFWKMYRKIQWQFVAFSLRKLQTFRKIQ